jgi:putative ATPase
MPPMHILNAPTKLMKTVGYGKGYAYDHDADEAFSGQDYWPEGMEREEFYRPSERGFEAKVRERLEFWAQRRKALQQSDGEAG